MAIESKLIEDILAIIQGQDAHSWNRNEDDEKQFRRRIGDYSLYLTYHLQRYSLAIYDRTIIERVEIQHPNLQKLYQRLEEAIPHDPSVKEEQDKNILEGLLAKLRSMETS